MREPEDLNFEPIHSDNDELVRRLRHLEWPAVRPEVRERCWNAFNHRLAERLIPVEEEQPRRNAGTRLDYRRRTQDAHVAPAQIGFGRRSWSARPTRRIAAFAA